jgi:hypothetical protein
MIMNVRTKYMVDCLAAAFDEQAHSVQVSKDAQLGFHRKTRSDKAFKSLKAKPASLRSFYVGIKAMKLITACLIIRNFAN